VSCDDVAAPYCAEMNKLCGCSVKKKILFGIKADLQIDIVKVDGENKPEKECPDLPLVDNILQKYVQVVV